MDKAVRESESCVGIAQPFGCSDGSPHHCRRDLTRGNSPGEAELSLFAIRLVHTIAWAVFAGAIIAIPPVIFLGYRRLAIWLSLLVWLEVGILAVNGLRCPLTSVAARYTANRAPNFDIFLPEWLARWNKWIFGTAFGIGQLLLWVP